MPFHQMTKDRLTQQAAGEKSGYTPASELSESELESRLNPIIDSALTSYGGGDKSLRPRAWVLAMEAVHTYDPSKGASLTTHVHGNLRRLNRIRAERSTVVHVPESVRTDSFRIKEFSRGYESDYGLEPSQELIADRLSMSRKRVQKALYQGEALTSSFESEKGESPETVRRSQYDIWADYVYHDLSETDKKLMEWLTGYGGSPMIQKNEAARRLKISPAAVSQRVAKISLKLQEGLG